MKAMSRSSTPQERGPMKHVVIVLSAITVLGAVDIARAADSADGKVPPPKAAASESPSTPTQTIDQQINGDVRGNTIPLGGESNDTTRARTPEDTLREILRDKRPRSMVDFKAQWLS